MTNKIKADWTDDIKAFGEHRDWKILPKRAFKQFRDFSGRPTADTKQGRWAAADAFYRAYETLRNMTADERASINLWGQCKAAIKARRKQLDREFITRAEAAAAKRIAELPKDPWSVVVYPDDSYGVHAGDWLHVTTDGVRDCIFLSVHNGYQAAQDAADAYAEDIQDWD